MSTEVKQLHLLYLIQNEPVTFRNIRTLLGVYQFQTNAEAAYKSFKNVYYEKSLYLERVNVSTDLVANDYYARVALYKDEE
jgi:chromosome segregation and condensation protein ScpB